AIWLRAASSSLASGMASSIAPRRSPDGLGRRRALDRRQLALDDVVAADPEPGREPVGEEPQALALAPEVEEVHPEVRRERRPAGQVDAPDLADRPSPPDHGERALVQVAERADRSRVTGADSLRHVRGL